MCRRFKKVRRLIKSFILIDYKSGKSNLKGKDVLTMSEAKTKGEELKGRLFMEKKNMGLSKSEEYLEKADLFSEGYKSFINMCKTEREVYDTALSIAREKGYKAFDMSKEYKAGDKVYLGNCQKALILATFGKKPLLEGTRIVASHIDCPRIDLKPQPVFEKDEIAYFKTHYYGGIKKYQWPTLPLAIHGVVILNDGKTVDIRVGESECDPVFVISDILPHLAQEQMKRSAGEIIKGEELNVIIGGRPFKDDKVSEKVKLNILSILFEKYGIYEEDFVSAELSLVPAHKACDVGFDRALIGGYGHDDRCCAYPSLMAEVEAKEPTYTTICVLADKEEVGSDGRTGLNSKMLEFFIEDLAENAGVSYREVLRNSYCLSSDVGAAFDPTFPDCFEKNNSARINYGPIVTKYTGSRGKNGTNDAPAETVGFVRKILNDNDVQWQTGELGKVDLGGGGTVAKFVGALQVNTIDMGVPVLSMHSPFELISKSDLYETFRAYEAFLK